MNGSERIRFDHHYRSCIIPSFIPKAICCALYALIIFTLSKINRYLALLYILLIIYMICSIAKRLLQYLLSAKTYAVLQSDEKESLIKEYYNYINDSKNIHEFGIITQYALICGEGMASWNNITEIAFKSKKTNWLETLTIGMSRDPCHMVVKACFNGKKYSWIVVLPGNYDLSPKIKQFISEALSRNNRIFIDNEYFFD